MNRIRLLALAVLPVTLLGGCESMSNTDKGVLAGGGLGATAGGIIGHQSGQTAGGAAIGGIIGAVAGGLTGSAIDQSERKQEARLAAAQANAPAAPLGLVDVAGLAQRHVSDEIIISQISTTGSVYHLSPNDIVWLKQNGVSDQVIQEMQATAMRYPRAVQPACGYHRPTAVYVIEQPPPPPCGVGISFGHMHRRRW